MIGERGGAGDPTLVAVGGAAAGRGAGDDPAGAPGEVAAIFAAAAFNAVVFDAADGPLATGPAVGAPSGLRTGEGVAGGAAAPGRGATMGRAVKPPVPAGAAFPGIIGRGGNSTGRVPPDGAGAGLEFSGLLTGAGLLAGGVRLRLCGAEGTAATSGIGVAARGDGGANESRSAVAIPAFPRWPADASPTL